MDPNTKNSPNTYINLDRKLMKVLYVYIEEKI
jgi:hypothetical protein